MWLLVAVAVLACHGAFGSLHLQSHEGASYEGVSHGGGGGFAGSVDASEAGFEEAAESSVLGLGGYAAALLSLLSVALWLRCPAARTLFPALGQPERSASSIGRRSIFIRGSNLPLLQVFRL